MDRDISVAIDCDSTSVESNLGRGLVRFTFTNGDTTAYDSYSYTTSDVDQVFGKMKFDTGNPFVYPTKVDNEDGTYTWTWWINPDAQWHDEDWQPNPGQWYTGEPGWEPGSGGGSGGDAPPPDDEEDDEEEPAPPEDDYSTITLYLGNNNACSTIELFGENVNQKNSSYLGWDTGWYEFWQNTANLRNEGNAELVLFYGLDLNYRSPSIYEIQNVDPGFVQTEVLDVNFPLSVLTASETMDMYLSQIPLGIILNDTGDAFYNEDTRVVGIMSKLNLPIYAPVINPTVSYNNAVGVLDFIDLPLSLGSVPFAVRETFLTMYFSDRIEMNITQPSGNVIKFFSDYAQNYTFTNNTHNNVETERKPWSMYYRDTVPVFFGGNFYKSFFLPQLTSSNDVTIQLLIDVNGVNYTAYNVTAREDIHNGVRIAAVQEYDYEPNYADGNDFSFSLVDSKYCPTVRMHDLSGLWTQTERLPNVVLNKVQYGIDWYYDDAWREDGTVYNEFNIMEDSPRAAIGNIEERWNPDPVSFYGSLSQWPNSLDDHNAQPIPPSYRRVYTTLENKNYLWRNCSNILANPRKGFLITNTLNQSKDDMAAESRPYEYKFRYRLRYKYCFIHNGDSITTQESLYSANKEPVTLQRSFMPKVAKTLNVLKYDWWTGVKDYVVNGVKPLWLKLIKGRGYTENGATVVNLDIKEEINGPSSVVSCRGVDADAPITIQNNSAFVGGGKPYWIGRGRDKSITAQPEGLKSPEYTAIAGFTDYVVFTKDTPDEITIFGIKTGVSFLYKIDTTLSSFAPEDIEIETLTDNTRVVLGINDTATQGFAFEKIELAFTPSFIERTDDKIFLMDEHATQNSPGSLYHFDRDGVIQGVIGLVFEHPVGLASFDIGDFKIFNNGILSSDSHETRYDLYILLSPENYNNQDSWFSPESSFDLRNQFLFRVEDIENNLDDVILTMKTKTPVMFMESWSESLWGWTRSKGQLKCLKRGKPRRSSSKGSMRSEPDAGEEYGEVTDRISTVANRPRGSTWAWFISIALSTAALATMAVAGWLALGLGIFSHMSLMTFISFGFMGPVAWAVLALALLLFGAWAFFAKICVPEGDYVNYRDSDGFSSNTKYYPVKRSLSLQSTRIRNSSDATNYTEVTSVSFVVEFGDNAKTYGMLTGRFSACVKCGHTRKELVYPSANHDIKNQAYLYTVVADNHNWNVQTVAMTLDSLYGPAVEDGYNYKPTSGRAWMTTSGSEDDNYFRGGDRDKPWNIPSKVPNSQSMVMLGEWGGLNQQYERIGNSIYVLDSTLSETPSLKRLRLQTEYTDTNIESDGTSTTITKYTLDDGFLTNGTYVVYNGEEDTDWWDSENGKLNLTPTSSLNNHTWRTVLSDEEDVELTIEVDDVSYKSNLLDNYRSVKMRAVEVDGVTKLWFFSTNNVIAVLVVDDDVIEKWGLNAVSDIKMGGIGALGTEGAPITQFILAPEDEQVVQFRLGFLYDDYQDAPLASTIIGGNAEAFLGPGNAEKHLIRIMLEVEIDQIPPRATKLMLYGRKGYEDSLGYFRLIKSIDIRSWQPETGGKIIEVIKPSSFNGASFESIAGYSSTLDSVDVQYKLATELNGELFVGGVMSAGSDSKLDLAKHIIKSEPGKYSVFNWPEKYGTINEVPTAMASFANRVFVFSPSSMYVLNPEGIYVEQKDDTMGAYSQDMVLSTDAGLFYGNRKGFWWHNGQQAKMISTPIYDSKSGYPAYSKIDWDQPVLLFHFPQYNIIGIAHTSTGSLYNTDSANPYGMFLFSLERNTWMYDSQFTGNPVGKYEDYKGDVYICTKENWFKLFGDDERSPWHIVTKEINLGDPQQDVKVYGINLSGYSSDYKISGANDIDNIFLPFAETTAGFYVPPGSPTNAIKNYVLSISGDEELNSIGIRYRGVKTK